MPAGFTPAKRFGACLVIVLTLSAVQAREPEVRSDVNRAFVDPDFDRWVATFERPGREVYDRRHLILAATGAEPGMTVADIGAGTGLFTRLFSERVGPSGKVYAVDISPVFVDNIVRVSKAHGRTNVIGVVNSASDVQLPPQSVDIAFICDTYHHFEKPLATMRSVRRALKPGGRLVVIDFRKIPGISTAWVLGHVRSDQAAVTAEIEATGFRLEGEGDLLKSNYFLRFKPSQEP